MASLPVRIAFSNNVSLDSLNHVQFSTGAHCVDNLKTHFIFGVAYRRKAISSRILQRLIEIFQKSAKVNKRNFSNAPQNAITFTY